MSDERPYPRYWLWIFYALLISAISNLFLFISDLVYFTWAFGWLLSIPYGFGYLGLAGYFPYFVVYLIASIISWVFVGYLYNTMKKRAGKINFNPFE